MRVIGLMSGTSLDGIDAALIEIDGDASNVQWKLLSFAEVAYDAHQRNAIHDAISSGDAASLCALHADLGEWLATAAARVAEKSGVTLDTVDVIGSHGQTVWHTPPNGDVRGATMQLGCPATIAERTGVSVVSDFRARDVAAHGHGAPLVPWADSLLFAHSDYARVLLNVGGMANLTWVPPRGDTRDVIAFDTGPGNVLIDAAMEIATSGAKTYDANGDTARAGAPDPALLTEMLGDPFFALAPPRSTGRERFGRAMVEQLIADGHDARALVSTLTELTARSIADAVQRWLPDRKIGEVIVTGGGARNSMIMQRLAELLAPARVISGAEAGIDPDAKEAIVFAALAWAHVQRIPGNMPAATGASGRRILGSFTPGNTKLK